MKEQSGDKRLSKVLGLMLVGLLILVSIALAFAQMRHSASQQERRRRVLPSATTATITVKARDDFQKALNAAKPGDTIVLEAGASYTGAFVLPYKAGTGTDSDYITIRSSRVSELTTGARVTPAQSSLMPKLVASVPGEPVIHTDPGAHHYRFIGIEMKRANASLIIYDLVRLGDGGAAQDSLSKVPHHLVFDRCYIHGDTGDLKRGIALNSSDTDITNSYLDDFHVRGQEAQAIGGWNTPGRLRIINNYIAGAGENIMFGGASGGLANLIPTEIEIRRNYVQKPLSWKGRWTVKNLLELKNARRVVIDGNIFDGNWVDAQVGYAILFTPRPNDSGAAAVVEDVEFTNNIVRNSHAALHLSGRDNLSQTPREVRASRIRIANNLFENIDWGLFGGGGDGVFMKIGSGVSGVVVEHNTVFHVGSITKSWEEGSPGLIFRNNLMAHNEYGIHGDNHAPGNDAISHYFPNSVFARNVIAGANQGLYPAGNFYPATIDEVRFTDKAAGNYRLAATSPYKGRATDGKDVGCDFGALEAARVARR